MWSSNCSSQKNESCCKRFNTHLWDFQGDRLENIHFEGKPRHVTPQIDGLSKMRPVLQCFNTHLWVSKEIDWKTFIFRVDLGMWSSNCSSQENVPCCKCFNTHLWDFQGDRWENIHFESNLGMWPLKSIISENWALLMWPLKSIVSDNWALFWGFQHTFMGSPRR